MKKKPSFQPIYFYRPLLTILLASILLQTGCDNAGGQTTGTTQLKDPQHWVTMDITFKPNTDEALIEKAIKDIEKMWIKEVEPFMKKEPNL